MELISRVINKVMETKAVDGIVSLTDSELFYLNRIGSSERPAGIIHNNSNKVIVRNRASLNQLKGWGVDIPETTTIWQKKVLNILRADIARAKDRESFNREYQLAVPVVGLILLRTRFTRLIFNGNIARMFEQIDCRIIGGI